MKLICFLIVFFLLSTPSVSSCPDLSYSISHQSECIRQRRLRDLRPRPYNWIFSCLSNVDSDNPQSTQQNHFDKDNLAPVHRTVPSSPVLKTQNSPKRETQLDDLPIDIYDRVALHLHRDEDVYNFTAASKIAQTSPTITIIRNIRRFCFVNGHRIFPDLTLAQMPNKQCADRIIASKGHFHIQALNITGVTMTLRRITYVASVVARMDLRHLYLSNCQITNEKLAILLSVSAHSKLLTLDLHWNLIDDHGAMRVAAVLSHSNLTTLNLNDNCIEDEGAKAIANVLPLSQLTFLDVGGNQICNGGARAIATVLPRTQLLKLCLQDNKTDFFGAKVIITSIRKSKLQFLDIGDNFFIPRGIQILEDMVKMVQRENFVLVIRTL